jgi:signal transduction histidine kinase
MSHELRTPMNAILGFGQMLEMDAEGFNETQRGNVNEILNAGQHLLTLINDILDLAKIESGVLKISMGEVRVDDALQQCVKLITPQAEAHQVELIDHVSGKGYAVQADSTRLKQVLVNLLSNAVKYNRYHGRVTLDSKIINNQRLRISVTDTGKGLSEDDISKLFTSFERLDVASGVEGTGIGLIISKHLIEIMGGTIGVESTPGEGSTFWVELALSNDA